MFCVMTEVGHEILAGWKKFGLNSCFFARVQENILKYLKTNTGNTILK
jgi:hypothetical protein